MYNLRDIDENDFPKDLKDWISRNQPIDIKPHQVKIGYDQMSAHEVLSKIIPSNIKFGCSFETIGHIAHLNLRDDVLPYKKVIGQVILDKNTQIKTVVTKVGTIESVYRTFDMEILAGEKSLVTAIKENDCHFSLDFSKVYYNTRLQTEHERLVNKYLRNPRCIVADITAGIGPFVIPALAKLPHKQGSLSQPAFHAFANDLNEISIQYLKKNASKNHVDHNITFYNMDGREFIKSVINDCYSKYPDSPYVTDFIINLPASSIEFMDAFIGSYHKICSKLGESKIRMPKVHCYCFTKDLENPQDDISKRLCSAMDIEIQNDLLRLIEEFHFVRRVSPSKDMYCVSFTLPKKVAFHDIYRRAGIKNQASDPISFNDTKKIKIK